MNMRLNLNDYQGYAFSILPRVAAGFYPVGKVIEALSSKTRAMISGPGSQGLIQAFVNINCKVGGKVLIVHSNSTYFIDNLSFMEVLPSVGQNITILTESEYSLGRQSWISAYSIPVFSQYSFSATTGLYLASCQHPAADMISRQIAFGDLQFSTQAYLGYQEQIRLTQKRYEQLPSFPPIFQELNAGIFKHQDLEDCLSFVEGRLGEFIVRTTGLQQRYTLAFNEHYRLQQSGLKKAYLAILETYHKLEQHYQKLAELRKKSEKKVHALSADTIWNELKNIHQLHSPFGVEWPDQIDKWTSADWVQWSKHYRSELTVWQDNHRNQLRETQIGLSLASAGEAAMDWQGLIDEQTALFERFNNTGLFQRPISGQAGTLLRSQKLLEHLLEKLLQLQRSLAVLPDFYHWQRNWFDLPAELRRVVAALMNRPEIDWGKAFAHWYFSGGLEAQQPMVVHTEVAGELAVMTPPEEIRGLTIIKADEAIPDDDFDLIIALGEIPSGLNAIELPILQWMPPGGEEEADVYVSRAGLYQPGLAFCQYWTSRQWANWQLAPYPQSPSAAAKAVAEFFQIETDLATSLVTQNRWSIIVQKEADQAPFILDKMCWDQSSFYRAMVLATSVNQDDELLGSLLPMLWAQATNLRILLDAQPGEITAALLSDGYSAAFGLAATLRGVEAIEDGDHLGWEAMAAEVRKRFRIQEVKPHPLLSELLAAFEAQFPAAKISLNYGWRDLHFPLLIESDDGKKTVVLVDDMLPGADTVALEVERRREITSAGFTIKTIFSTEIMTQPATFPRLYG